MKNKLIKGAVAGAALLVVAVVGVFGYRVLFPAKPAAAANTYMTAVAKKMNLQVNIQGTGSAYAAISKEITANNSGEIKSLTLNVGDTVKAGDKLFVVDSEQLKENLTKAQNNLEKQKLQLANAKNEQEITMQNFAISDAEKAVATAKDQINKMTVKAPIGGTVVAKNNITGDTLQAGKAVLTIVDTTDIKIKVAVDELDISKVVQGQKAEVKFDAIRSKVYEGTVESIGITGNSSNNVTTYDVIVSIKDPAGIRLGMNGNVNILVESKENALVIPAEALVENNGKNYVMVPQTEGTAPSQTGENQQGTQSSQNGIQRKRIAQGGFGTSSGGRLVEIKIGLENENYIEVLEGITEGQQILIALPQSTTTTTNNRINLGGLDSFGGQAGKVKIPKANGGQK